MIHLWLVLWVIGGVFANAAVNAEAALDPLTPRLTTADAGRGEKNISPV